MYVQNIIAKPYKVRTLNYAENLPGTKVVEVTKTPTNYRDEDNTRDVEGYSYVKYKDGSGGAGEDNGPTVRMIEMPRFQYIYYSFTIIRAI